MTAVGAGKEAGWLPGAAGRLGLVILLAACAAPGLRFKPEVQPSGIPISADYTVTGDRLRVVVDTGGYRVEEAGLVLASGAVVAPRAIDHPVFREASRVGVGLGADLSGGGGGWSGGGGFGITFGAGEGVRGAGQVDRETRIAFDLGEAGAKPWRLRLKVVGVPRVEIVLGNGDEP